MAKEKEKDETPASSDVQVNLTDLVKILGMLNQDSNKNLAETLATALAKLQPGYQTPEQKELAQKLREDQKNIEIEKLKRKRRAQRFCEHEVGQNGRHRNGEGAFCCLKLPTGEMIGVCQYCQMVISSANPEHQKFFRKANGTPAESGQFEGIMDVEKAQLARLTPDQRKKVEESRAKFFAAEKKDFVEEEELI